MVHGPCNANIHFKWGKAVLGLSHFEAVFGFRSFVGCENVNRFHGKNNNKSKIFPVLFQRVDHCNRSTIDNGSKEEKERALHLKAKCPAPALILAARPDDQ